MALLFQPYAETPFRQFANRVLAVAISHVLRERRRHKTPGPTLPTWRVRRGRHCPFPDGSLPVDDEFLGQAVRYWSWYVAMARDGQAEWGRAWLDMGLPYLPAPSKVDWHQWEATLTHWLQEGYRAYADMYWHPTLLSEDQWLTLWAKLGCNYLEFCGLTASEDVVHAIIGPETLALPRTWASVNNAQVVMDSLTQLLQVSMAGRPIPNWAVGGPKWMVDEDVHEPPLWDLPLHILSNLLERPMTVDTVDVWLETHGKSFADRLVSSLARVDWRFRFWFPLADRKMAAPGAAVVGDDTRLIGLTDDEVKRLNQAQYAKANRLLEPADLVVEVDVQAGYLAAGLTEARSKAGDVQALLRIATPQFQWDYGPFLYWQALNPPKDLPESDVVFAMRQDNYQLPVPVDPNKVSEFFQQADTLAQRETDLATDLLVAMRWQGLARGQTNPENEFLCMWIALERIGEGSWHVNKQLPKLAARLWRTSLRANLPASEAEAELQCDQVRMGELIDRLKHIRDRDVAHRGAFRSRYDVRYATWLLMHLTNDLTRWLLEVVQTTNVADLSAVIEALDTIDSDAKD